MNTYEKNLEKSLIRLQDDILDEYNRGLISHNEMVNMMNWTKRIIKAKVKNELV